MRCVLAILALSGIGACSQNWTPPIRQSPLPTAMVDVLTPDGWVTMPANEAAAYPASPTRHTTRTSAIDVDPVHREGFAASRDWPYYRPPALEIPRPRVESFGPVSPQYYYVRPEQTPKGLSPGRYGRVGDFTPGEYSPRGYETRHYRRGGLST